MECVSKQTNNKVRYNIGYTTLAKLMINKAIYLTRNTALIKLLLVINGKVKPC